MIDLAVPLAPTKTCVRTRPDLPASVRLVNAATSTLLVGVAPWSQARRLAALPEFSTPAVYVLDGEAGRIGKTGDLDQRLRDHSRTPPMARIDEVVVVTSPAFTADVTTCLEAALSQIARSAGVLPIIGAPLAMPVLDPHEDRDLLHWLAEMPTLLLAAGCRLFEADYEPMPARIAAPEDDGPVAIGAGAVRQGWDETFPADLLRRPTTAHYVLERNDLRAEAAVNACWTVLKAGSQLTAETQTWDQVGVANKRKYLRDHGLLKPEPAGRYFRLARDIALPSLTNAGRLVLGTNHPATVWRPA
jgi:hypothetical protein